MSLSLDPQTTALVLIDLQNGILSLPLSPHAAPEILTRTAALARRFAMSGGTLVLVHVAFADAYADQPNQDVDAPMALPEGGLPKAWSCFVPEIGSLDADVTIVKRQWGAFHGTELDLQLRRRGIATVVLAGVATNFGVESTAREAWQHHYRVIVAEDACSSLGEGMHQFSIDKILPRIARVRSTTQVLAALQPGG
jgi:nicotinamidase-related amidase